MVDYVRLGATGVEVSEFCLGTWMFGSLSPTTGTEFVDRDAAHSILDKAWEAGVNFLDTANVYGDGGSSERYIGEWLRGKDREDFVVASKVFFALSGRQEIGLSRKIVLAEIDGTLERLGTDYLDIYYIHGWHDPSPLVETLSALNDLVRLGKVHYIGVSNFTAWQLILAKWICDANGYAPVSVIQPRYNAVDHFPFTVDPDELPLPDLFDACRYTSTAVCPYSPLAEGFLTGKYQRTSDGDVSKPDGSRAAHSRKMGNFPERWWEVLTAVEQVASDVGATPAQVAIRWAAMIPDIVSVPIVGATSPEQLEETLRAASVTLTEDQHRAIADAGRYSDVITRSYSYT